jgi:hypothetical protein
VRRYNSTKSRPYINHSNTAKILGIDAQCGTLEIGKMPLLFLSAGDALDMRTNKISHAFIQGRDISLETHQSVLNKRYKENTIKTDQLRFLEKNRQFTLV